jgi:hypothetical protein
MFFPFRVKVQQSSYSGTQLPVASKAAGACPAVMNLGSVDRALSSSPFKFATRHDETEAASTLETSVLLLAALVWITGEATLHLPGCTPWLSSRI